MVQFREPVEVAQLFLYHTKIWGEAFADRCELFVQDPGGAYRSLRQFRHRQPWSSIEFPATKAQRFKLVFQTFDNFAKYVVSQILPDPETDPWAEALSRLAEFTQQAGRDRRTPGPARS